MSDTTANLLYLATIVSFIVALRFLSSPRRARLGNLVGAGGMLPVSYTHLTLPTNREV